MRLLSVCNTVCPQKVAWGMAICHVCGKPTDAIIYVVLGTNNSVHN